jgi:hypothetical protein
MLSSFLTKPGVHGQIELPHALETTWAAIIQENGALELTFHPFVFPVQGPADLPVRSITPVAIVASIVLASVQVLQLPQPKKIPSDAGTTGRSNLGENGEQLKKSGRNELSAIPASEEHQ